MLMSSFLATLSLFSYVSSPVVDMREEPKQDSEIVSQACFSEEVHILKGDLEHSDWLQIETVADHYRGWIQKGALCQRQTPLVSTDSTKLAMVNQCAAHVYHVQDTVYGPIITLPFGSKVEVLDQDSNNRWIQIALVDGRKAYIQRGDVNLNPTVLTANQMCRQLLLFLGSPYTWGGCSSFGFDCSGLAKEAYKLMGIPIPRDSKDQFLWDGFVPVSLDEMIPGDLIFFGPEEGKVRHVGVYLGKKKFIHSTVAENQPRTRISRLPWDGGGRFTFCAARTLRKK